MPRPPAIDLHRELARSIVEYLRTIGVSVGHSLSESGLAAAVGTSRSPVRGAVAVLLESGILQRRPDGRLCVARLPVASEEVAPEEGEAERLYWAIASDRIAGHLPDLIGEASLMRRYGAPRGTIHRALLQIMGEGWIERAPAGVWRFLALIDGPGGYDEAYRFRRALEPAALLDPSFSLAPSVASRLRREQEKLLAQIASEPDPREVFEANSGFHLALMQASGNRFFADAGLRITRLRRLVGYVIALDQDRLAAQSEEHLAILDQIEHGNRDIAAELLIQHLDAGRASKGRLLNDVRLRGTFPAPLSSVSACP